MKAKFIEELQDFKARLNSIDANYETIKPLPPKNSPDKILGVLDEIEPIVTDILNRVKRFYTESSPYHKKLNELAHIFLTFRGYYGEHDFAYQRTIEDCKLMVINTLDGMIKELELYGLPSEKDPKFDNI